MQQENYEQTRDALRVEELRRQSLQTLYDITSWNLLEQARTLEEMLTRYDEKAGFNPSQARDDHGRWADGGGDGSSSSYGTDGNYYDHGIYDPPIDPVYPIENAIGFFAGGGAARAGINAARGVRAAGKLTQHGTKRIVGRKITNREIQKAIKSAKKTGNFTTKVGKYGTPQVIYKGSNGITIIIERSGRNAGKIITLWRH